MGVGGPDGSSEEISGGISNGTDVGSILEESIWSGGVGGDIVAEGAMSSDSSLGTPHSLGWTVLGGRQHADFSVGPDENPKHGGVPVEDCLGWVQ